MRTSRSVPLALTALLVPALLVACGPGSTSGVTGATRSSDAAPPDGDAVEAAVETVTAADGPQRYAVAMGGVDPEIRAAYDAEGLEPEVMGSERRTDRFEYLAFYPERLQVHRGDRIDFLAEGFHSVLLFLEPDQAPGFHVRGPEEGVIGIDGGGRPSDPTCIAASTAVPEDGGVCTVTDASTPWSTGFNSASVALDLPPGTYSFVCGVHVGMTGRIEILEDDAPVPSPAEVDATRLAQQAEDTANAESVLASEDGATLTSEDGRRVWTLKAGDFTPDGRVAIIRFLPGDLTITEGDEVRWVVPESPGYEVHTVTFPADAYPMQIATYFTQEGTIQPFAWREPNRAPGDVVAGTTAKHDSGWLGQAGRACPWVCDPWTGQRWPNETSVTFGGPGTYSYACLIHPERGMRGSITVVPA